MSKSEGKRGLRRTQHTSAVLNISSPAWDEALGAFEAAEKAHDAACEENRAAARDGSPETLQAYYEARDRLLGTPAPNGSALAYKLAVVLHAFTSLEGDLRSDEERQWVFEHGDDGDRAALALYFDALALSGVRATVPVPAIPAAAPTDEPELLDWQGIKAKADEISALYTGYRAGPEGRASWEGELSVLTEHAAALAVIPTDDAPDERIIAAATAGERLARALCEARDGYCNWAVNPDGMLELVQAVTLIQSSLRALASQKIPGLAGVAIQRAFFTDDETPPQPPRGPGGGLPLPANDPAAEAYVKAKAISAEFARMEPSDPRYPAYRLLDQQEGPAGDALLRSPPSDLSGVAVRLGYIISNAFLHRAGAWDEPGSDQRREPVSPPSDIDLCASAEGQNGGEDALFRALACLHLATEQLALDGGAEPDSDGARFLAWEAEAARLYTAYQAEDRRLDADEAEVDRLYDGAMRLLRQILSTPGQGPTVAATKLRAMLHPDVGVARLAVRMGADDAQGIYTALAAITGTAPFNPFDWIARYEAAGGKVRKVRVQMGGGDAFAVLFSHSDTAEAERIATHLAHELIQHTDHLWAIFHAAENEVAPGAAARTVSQITEDEQADGRVVVSVAFPNSAEG